MIRLHNISHTYLRHGHKKEVLKNISLILPDRGLFMIQGESGAGKTTLLSILGLLRKPTADELFVDGSMINFDDRQQLRKIRAEKISYVFQNHNFIADMTVAMNLQLVCSDNQKIEATLTELSLAGFSSRLISGLSGGELKRVALARVFLTESPIVLVDEPFANLDRANCEQIAILLRKLSSRSLVVMISHDNDLLWNEATGIMQLKEGNLKCSGFFEPTPTNVTQLKLRLPDSRKLLIKNALKNLRVKSLLKILFSSFALALLIVVLAFAPDYKQMGKETLINSDQIYFEIRDSNGAVNRTLAECMSRDFATEDYYAASVLLGFDCGGKKLKKNAILVSEKMLEDKKMQIGGTTVDLSSLRSGTVLLSAEVAVALDATLDRTLTVDFSSNVFTDWIDRSFGGVYEFKVGEIEPTGDYIFMRADDYVRKLTDNGFILEGAVFEEMRYSVPPFQKIKFERLPKSSSLQFLYGSPELTELFPSGTLDTSYTPAIDHLLVNSVFSHFYPSIIDQVLTGSAVSCFAPDRRQLPFADLVPFGKFRVDGIVATDSSASDIPTVYISDSLYAAICEHPNVFYDSLWLNIFSNTGYYDTLYDNYSIEDNSFKNALQSRNDLEVFQVIVLALGIALVTAGCLFIFVVDYSEIKERHYEIALLKSFGTDDRRIIAGYIWLPLWLGLAVVVIAAGLGTLFAFGLDQSLLAFFRSDFSPSHILRLSWWHYLLLLATVLVPVIAAGSLIIRYLKNIDIEEIIRKGR